MAITKQISVGHIDYYITDTIPTFTASKGSVAIVQEDGWEPVMYMNNNGATKWIKTFKPSYGSSFFSNNTTGGDVLGDTLGSWFNTIDTSINMSVDYEPGGGTSFYSGFSEVTAVGSSVDHEGFNTAPVARTNAGVIEAGILHNSLGFDTYLVKANQEFEVQKWWWDIEAGPSQDNAEPVLYQGTTINNALDPSIGGLSTVQIEEYEVGSWMTIAYSQLDGNGGGGGAATTTVTLTDGKITVSKVNSKRRGYLFKTDWSIGSFSGAGWTLVNDSTNVWVIGSAESVSAGQCAYISDDGGTTASFAIGTANISHFYRDIFIPTGATSAYLVFDWKCWAENASATNNWDYGTVNITSTANTITAGSEIETIEATGNDNVPRPSPSGDGRIGAYENLSATRQFGKYNEGFGGSNAFWHTDGINLTNYIGVNKRLVFTWVNDGSQGADPPFVLDNIELVYY